MRYDLTTPCAQCPFRSDITPFIRPERAQEILSGDAFACHKTLDAEGRIHDASQHCAGVLIILEHDETPHQMMRICERIGLYDRRKLRMDAPVYQGADEAIAAHKRRWKKRA